MRNLILVVIFFITCEETILARHFNQNGNGIPVFDSEKSENLANWWADEEYSDGLPNHKEFGYFKRGDLAGEKNLATGEGASGKNLRDLKEVKYGNLLTCYEKEEFPDYYGGVIAGYIYEPTRSMNTTCERCYFGTQEIECEIAYKMVVTLLNISEAENCYVPEKRMLRNGCLCRDYVYVKENIIKGN